ncbi:MAG: phosphoenolpyruvate carboxykinase (ATP) [Calditrichia bacterium]
MDLHIKQMKEIGLKNWRLIYRNLSAPTLVEHAIIRGEGILAANGALIVRTGERTGRSPNDRFFVEDSTTKDRIAWGKSNAGVKPEVFDHLFNKIQAYMQGKELYVQDVYVGVDEDYRMPLRVVSELAWGALFARTQFIRPEKRKDIENHQPEFTVLHAPNLQSEPELDGTNSNVFVVINLEKKLILVGGTHYGGEIKKSIFTAMNFILPQKGVFPMHCSANVAQEGDVALFFGLSGTGKTSLSADPDRRLIGDDEHGWSENGVFNFEGGCYAKAIDLTIEKEPQIYNAIRFGSIAENVIYDDVTRKIDFSRGDITENTRATYPVEHIDNVIIPGIAGHPSNVMFLTADAFGVLPPISKLTPEMAMYHFMSGYTSKLAGTEAGITEPQATFSACFGEPFMPLPIVKYAEMLGDKLRKHNAQVWLVNTGWSGGPYGTGKRMDIRHTRAMIKAALSGKLDNVGFEPHPIFKVLVPQSCCAEVPDSVLSPRNTWENKEDYDRKAKELAKRFNDNFKRFPNATDEIKKASPKAD